MLQRQSEPLTEELRKVDAWLSRSPQTDREAVGRRIGRHLGKYPATAAIIVAEVGSDTQGRAASLREYSRLDAGQKARRQKGAYLLRTNCEETDPALLWRWYIQLTQAEAAFRTAKSDLELRPVFHHREDRVQAHIRVCFLALAPWRTLEQWMQSKGLGCCARQLIKEMAGIKSVDVIVPVQRAGVARICACAWSPEPAAAQLLAHLGLRLPQGSPPSQRCSAKSVPENSNQLIINDLMF